MAVFPDEYIEKIYAGWLAKVIGVRLGAPIEGWTYDKIRHTLGQPDGYVANYRNFAADDDTNGSIFFLRALEDKPPGQPLEPAHVATALLNYVPYEHGFFWWGGYGVSTEHTAYLNLQNGIPAPRSGSAEQNGLMLAEQIGGQIFIDTWGLVAPGNPDLAACLAEAAASVTHGQNGVFGGVFIAAAISEAFVEKDIGRIIEKGLAYLPEDCEYRRVVNAVIDFHQKDREKNHDQASWENCYHYIYKHFGYDKYPGACHIIPNAAVIILSLLYGEGDFSKTITICNRCGWDTDCNAGNVATIMGVRNGLDAIDYEKWRRPVNDLLICSSVVGSLNIMDIPYGAAYMVKLAAAMAGQELSEPWRTIVSQAVNACHFEFPGSTHAIRARLGTSHADSTYSGPLSIINSTETAFSGQRSLKIAIPAVHDWEEFFVYKKTYYLPDDFDDSRYDPCFSPLVYSGQTIRGAAMAPAYGCALSVQLYAHDLINNNILRSEAQTLEAGQWKRLSWQLPAGCPTLIDEIGFVFNVRYRSDRPVQAVAFIDDLFAEGCPDYRLDFSDSTIDVWSQTHRTLAQFSRLKGNHYLDNGRMHLSAADFAEIYTGSHDWRDYEVTFELTPLAGPEVRVNFRVQGAMRCYAVAFLEGDRICLLKNDSGYSSLLSRPFVWQQDESYTITVRAKKAAYTVFVNGEQVFSYVDDHEPFLYGAIGYSAFRGSRLSSHGFSVKPIQEACSPTQ
ncbi:MAG TPA: ADP-ribosylglycohydrolase family protein [Bacillota bacterium]|nr:ADP-ribosylglycohydrolase family protein [Fastidiosipila sp.]HPX92793.1 ADP-ribosylglycohydrolase family protein [Bacillota bacterium]HQB81670.1 ADP-ribosylglycohydrolase family protein [Bacillota bacterium]